MRSGLARGPWLALLCAAVSAACLDKAFAAPEEAAPEGFVWESLKEIRASVLRPKKWFFRRVVPALPIYEFSPQAFTGPMEYPSGVMIHVMQRTNQFADEVAASRIAQMAAGQQVLRGWTRKGVPAEPFTTYGLVCVLQGEETYGVKCTCEIVLVANRLTNTVYECSLFAPVGEWKAVEASGEEMLAGLRLDPEF